MGNKNSGGGAKNRKDSQHTRDKSVNAELKTAKRNDQSVEKLLLLGAGGSGKSTFLKQLKYIHGAGHTAREVEGFRKQIFGQIIDAMQALVQQCTVVKDDDGNESKIDGIESDLDESAKFIMAFDLTARFADVNETVTSHLEKLWKSKAIRAMYEKRGLLAIPDSTEYFFANMDRLKEANYQPTDDDILFVRHRTTGMTEQDFVINGKTLRVVDVGGQRNERKKWIHFFDNVRAVVFVASLTAYDEVPFEDVTDLETDLTQYNNMIESLDVFRQTLNSETFFNSGVILFLNKADLMRDKIKRVNITAAFPDYDGAQEFDPTVEYIKQQYYKRDKNPDRNVFCHVTCATDRKNVESLFNDVQVCVVNMSLDQCGIV